VHPRFAARHRQKTPSVFDRVTPKFCSRPGGRTGFGSITLGASSPDGAKRNPGAILQSSLPFRDCAALHPGYEERKKKK
jgi:hypothetical protein